MTHHKYLAGAAALALLIAVPVAATHQNHGLRGSFSGQGVSAQNYVPAGSWQQDKLRARLAAQQAYRAGYGQDAYYAAAPRYAGNVQWIKVAKNINRWTIPAPRSFPIL